MFNLHKNVDNFCHVVGKECKRASNNFSAKHLEFANPFFLKNKKFLFRNLFPVFSKLVQQKSSNHNTHDYHLYSLITIRPTLLLKYLSLFHNHNFILNYSLIFKREAIKIANYHIFMINYQLSHCTPQKYINPCLKSHFVLLLLPPIKHYVCVSSESMHVGSLDFSAAPPTKSGQRGKRTPEK